MDVEFTGLGLGFGGMGQARIGCGFSLVGEAQLLGVIGYKRANSYTRSLVGLFRYDDVRVPSKHTSRACMVPGVQGNLALQYCRDLCCGTLCAHVGYETHFYYEVVDTAHEGPFVQNEPDNHHALTENAGFGGLTLGASFSY